MMHVYNALAVLLTSKGNPSTQHFVSLAPLYIFSIVLNPKLRHSLSLVSFGNFGPRLFTDPCCRNYVMVCSGSSEKERENRRECFGWQS